MWVLPPAAWCWGNSAAVMLSKRDWLSWVIRLDEDDLNRAFQAFKDLADKKKEVTDKDIESVVAQQKRTVAEVYHLEMVQVSCGNGMPTAAVRLTGPDGEDAGGCFSGHRTGRCGL